MTKRMSLEVTGIIEVAPNVKSFFFSFPIEAKPGQFMMVSDLKNGEKPFSISSSDPSGFSVTIKALGPFSSKILNHKVGEFLSVRGPFGKPFDLKKGSILIAGGGCGVPPLVFLAREITKSGSKITFINGARCSEELIFQDLIKDLG